LKRFGYLRDPLFLLGCGLYAANRWIIKPHTQLEFFHDWFNDVLLISCALPPVLLIHERLGLRPGHGRPTFREIAAHWAGWSVLFEWIGPHIMRTTGDPWDVAAYAVGGLGAYLWWCRAGRLGPQRTRANFDRLAPHYHWLEKVLAGGKLHRCRTAFLSTVPPPGEALLLGEGHGRFLAELLTAHPGVRCTCVDSSAKMLAGARRKLEGQGFNLAGVEFVQADVLEWKPPAGKFDLIVTCFFLDCFSAEQLARLMPRIAGAAVADARWLVADFRKPESGWKRWRAAWILESMYLFFTHATALPASRITPIEPFLEGQGFVLQGRRTFEWGLLHSDLWQLGARPAGSRNTADSSGSCPSRDERPEFPGRRELQNNTAAGTASQCSPAG